MCTRCTIKGIGTPIVITYRVQIAYWYEATVERANQNMQILH